MRLIKKSSSMIVSASVATLMLTSSAFALEGMALVDFFVKKAAEEGGTISWTNAEELSSDSVVLNEVTLSDGGKDPINIKSVRLEGFKMVGDDRLEVRVFDVQGVATPDGARESIKVGSVRINDGSFPADPEQAARPENAAKHRVSFGRFEVNGFEFMERGNRVSVTSSSIEDADIPMKWDYDRPSADAGDVPPMKIGRITVNGVDVDADGGQFAMGSFLLSSLQVPSKLSTNVSDWLKVMKVMKVSNITFGMGGTRMFSLGSGETSLDSDTNPDEVSQETKFEDINLDLTKIPDRQFQAVRGQLGYEKLNGRMVGIGSWNMKTGRAAVSEMKLDFTDVGALDLTYAITGYTVEVAQRIQQIQLEAAANGGGDQAMMALMPELTKLKLESFAFKFTDASITNKLLTLQAGQMGQTPEALAGAAPMFVQMGMQGLNMPQLSEMVAKAVGQFLSSPKNIEVAARPAAPVPVSEIVGAGMAAPQTIPGMINLQVVANQ
ncbi:MAG: hypothetical protein AAF468_08820 [Pseudomonadota bacterium]